LIVLHTAEGARTIESLGDYFANPATKASSHVGADDKVNTIGEFVKSPFSAWTQGRHANPISLSIEMCAFASWNLAEWNKHPNLLQNCASWIAEEAERWKIPITKLTAAQAQGLGRGVCQHRDLGVWGGGHHDCGDGFPMDRVLEMARGNGKEDELGYPDWYWDWSNWYLTTDRDPNTRPASAPQNIPQWAWDANDELNKITYRSGMTADERKWIDWVLGGKVGPRPNVPETIPDRWWDDHKYVAGK
jgi:hypothetical protein